MKKGEINNILNNLSNLIEKRYELFLELISLEIDDLVWNEQYSLIVQKLNVLTAKENRLVKKLSLITKELLEDDELYDSDIFFGIYLTDDNISSRFDSIISETEIFSENEFVYAGDIIQDEDDDEYSDEYEKEIKKRLDLEFLMKLQKIIEKEPKETKNELIEYKYKLIFANKKINDILETSLYNPNNLFELPLSLEIKDLDEKKYKKTEKFILYSKVLDLFNDILFDNAITEEKNALAGQKAHFMFMLKKLDYIQLSDLKQVVDYCIDEENKDIISEISDIIKNLVGEKQKEYNIEHNEICEPLDEKNISNIISLVKLEKLILKTFTDLPKHNDKNEQIKKIKNLMEIEKEIIENIKIDEYNLERILDIIDNYIVVFLNDFDFNKEETNRENQFIINRIKGAINQIYNLNDEPSILTLSKQSILTNNMLDSLITYSKKIKTSKDATQNEIYEKIYYQIWYSNYLLSYDFVVTKGNARNVIIMNNKLCAQYVGTSDIEYCYDKDIELFNIGHEIIKEIENMNLSNMEDNAYLEFLEIKLNKIYENISDEHLFELKDEFNNINPAKKGKCKLLYRQTTKTLKDIN